MTLEKIAKDAKGSGFAGPGVNGGGTFLSPTLSFERRPRRLLSPSVLSAPSVVNFLFPNS